MIRFVSYIGLLKVSDKIFVPFQILLEWRRLFQKGVPISIAIKSKLEAMRDRISVSISCELPSKPKPLKSPA